MLFRSDFLFEFGIEALRRAALVPLWWTSRSRWAAKARIARESAEFDDCGEGLVEVESLDLCEALCVEWSTAGRRR